MIRPRTHVDFETRSIAQLVGPKAVGEHNYAMHSSTLPLLLAYNSPGMNRTEVEDLHEQYRYTDKLKMPIHIERAIDEEHIFVAHNARFEQAIWYWQCHKRFGWPMPKYWSCTAARARNWGVRASLAGCAEDLQVQHQKDKRGDELIKVFCMPRRVVKGVIRKPWAEPWDEPEQWAEFIEYCRRDVDAEMDVDAVLPDLDPFEQRLWEIDFKMNTKGLPLDMDSVHKAIELSDHFTADAVAKFEAITGGLRPTQRDRVLEYVNSRELALENLRSKTLRRLNMADLETDLQELVSIRIDAAKAGAKKLWAMIRAVSPDNMARGLFLYYGAHTGRWSGKRVQPHNFVRGSKAAQKAIFWLLETFSGADLIEYASLTLPRPLASLAEAMRGFIKAPKGKRFVVADYKQIEARVLAWLAGEEILLKAFREGLDPYKQFATQAYGVALMDVTPDQRQVSKSAVLGCGFGLGGAAFVEYCDNMDIIIDEDSAKSIVYKWRNANPNIVRFWGRIEKGAIITTETGRPTSIDGRIRFTIHRESEERYWLVMTCPSGSAMRYFRPKVELVHKWGAFRKQLSFRTEWNGRMSIRESTYGGKLTENAVQKIARDIMGQGMSNADEAGYDVRGTVHDEVITLADDGFGSVKELEDLLCVLSDVYAGCPIEAEGYECVRYTK